MPFVKHVHDRHHVHTRAVPVRCVNVVAYGYKAYAVGGKYVIEILSDHDIVSSEAGEVFYHNGIDATRFCIVQQPLHFGAFK